LELVTWGTGSRHEYVTYKSQSKSRLTMLYTVFVPTGEAFAFSAFA
jgi:hypothetical protein